MQRYRDNRVILNELNFKPEVLAFSGSHIVQRDRGFHQEVI